MEDLPALPVPSAKHQLQGLKNRAAGKAFEERLDKTFEYYKAHGYAQIDKTPEPMKILRRLENGRFLACFLKKSQPDYRGTVHGVRSVMFEAKYTSQDRMTQDVINEKQWEYMELSSSLGARCYVLAGFGSGNVYRIPWNVWANMKSCFGHKYVTEAELKKYQVQKSWNDLLLILT